MGNAVVLEPLAASAAEIESQPPGGKMAMPELALVPANRMYLTRRTFLTVFGLAGASIAVGGCAAAPPLASTAAPAIGTALVGGLVWLGGKLLDDARGWLLGKGLDDVVDRLDAGEAKIDVVRYPDDSGVVVIAAGDEDPVDSALWVSSFPAARFEDWKPRGWQAIVRAGRALEADIGRQKAIGAVLPARSGVDSGTGAHWRRSTYVAVDGHEVIVTFDGTSGTPVETVELTGWQVSGVNWSASYAVDPANLDHLRQ
jgi:hypothetical protein